MQALFTSIFVVLTIKLESSTGTHKAGCRGAQGGKRVWLETVFPWVLFNVSCYLNHVRLLSIEKQSDWVGRNILKLYLSGGSRCSAKKRKLGGQCPFLPTLIHFSLPLPVKPELFLSSGSHTNNFSECKLTGRCCLGRRLSLTLSTVHMG